ncbi:MAG: hypothetical protein ABS79_07630 [Planctomycetes bacterium SCN 63-9]|nr:MAG: hypothetical protein ABS79_07630 [Planctomycetes bacterium SCN 63-9]
MMQKRSVFLIVLGIGVGIGLTGVLVAAAPSAQDELSKHQGTWSVVSFRRSDKETPEEITRSIVRIVEGDRVLWKRDGKAFAATTIELDPSRTPATINVIPEGGPDRNKRILGIYKLDGNNLLICMADAGHPRPTEFKANPRVMWTLMRLQRKTPNR